MFKKTGLTKQIASLEAEEEKILTLVKEAEMNPETWVVANYKTEAKPEAPSQTQSNVPKVRKGQ